MFDSRTVGHGLMQGFMLSFGGGAHFTMSGSRQFLKGNKVKGLVLRKAGGGTKQQQANARRANASRGGDG